MNPIGKIYKVIIDRPINSFHPIYKDIVYQVNYGYIEGIIANDFEEQDVYLLGIDEPVETYEGEIIAIIHRLNDNEDKWVMAPKGKNYDIKEILEKVYFMEKYFESIIIR